MARGSVKAGLTQRSALPRSIAPTLKSLKSAQTRAKMIEATISCIVLRGYANTTTPMVAAEARLSRGAMLHHFENGTGLIKAAIVELHEERLRGDCQDFRVWAGIMGKKEIPYVPTQRAFDTE